MNWLSFFRNGKSIPSAGQLSFSQCGEDRIVDFVLKAIGISRPRYLDVGAFDAVYMSNSYAFYRRGSSGCCVEANPALARKIAKHRPRDQVLNVAVSGALEGTIELYIMSEPTLSTTSRTEAERLCREENCHIESVQRIPVKPINQVVLECFPERSPDFLSLDIEGDELEVIRHLDFGYMRPKVMCIESLSYSRTGIQHKNEALIGFMQTREYMVYGDTYINTIFVDREVWHRRSAQTPLLHHVRE